MIWHETRSTAVIVMLTETTEAGRDKCHQYFPGDNENDTLDLDMSDGRQGAAPSTIKQIEKSYDEKSRSTIRRLSLSYGEESKTIWHLLFSNWMDFTVPEDEDRAALLELIKLSSEKNIEPTHPRIIHCSAGVGRSGTFISLEYLLAELHAGNLVNAKEDDDPIFDTVNRLREQRMMMVQSEVQYQFLYDVLREEFLNTQQTLPQETETEGLDFAEPKMLATEKLSQSGSGEPSPKVMRLARGFKVAFLVKRPRSERSTNLLTGRSKTQGASTAS